MTLFRSLRHLLPTGRAWRLTVEKNLRRFFEGVAAPAEEARGFADNVYRDIFPGDTRELPAWDRQFGLPDSGLSDADRRNRLDAAWKAIGGQSPRYIQDTLQARGFDVYVHEWWEPGTEPAPGVQGCATARNPLLWIRREFTNYVLLVECGEALAACGEDFAQAGNSLQELCKQAGREQVENRIR